MVEESIEELAEARGVSLGLLNLLVLGVEERVVGWMAAKRRKGSCGLVRGNEGLWTAEEMRREEEMVALRAISVAEIW